MGRVKRAGCDCLTFLAEVYERCGVTGHVDVPFYPPDWHLHRDEERYVAGVLLYAREYWLSEVVSDPEIPIKLKPEPGDIALFKFGRAHAHGVVVVDWPLGIDSWVSVGVGWRDTTTLRDVSGAARSARHFDPFT